MISAIGIDYGTKRIGIAGCDAMGISARGIDVVEERTPEKAADRIAQIAREREATILVFGMPYNMDGSEGGRATDVRRFMDTLRERFPKLDVIPQDERLSTKEAEELLRESGLSAEKRRKARDSWSAVVILQDWVRASGG